MTDRRTDGRTDRQTDRGAEERTDGRTMDRLWYEINILFFLKKKAGMKMEIFENEWKSALEYI